MTTGAYVGGIIVGYLSQWVGRRHTISVAAFISCCTMPAWILPQSGRSFSATSFFILFFAQGACGVIPIHLTKVSPATFRSSFPLITYQLGNLNSSSSAQIVHAFAENTLISRSNGDRVEAYGPVMGVATVIFALGIVVTSASGPEKKGAKFELARVAGQQEMEIRGKLESDAGLYICDMEKTVVTQQVEKVPSGEATRAEV